MLNRCQSTTPRAASTRVGDSNGSSKGIDKLGQIVPELLLEPPGSAHAAPAWPVGPFDTPSTILESLLRALEARDPYTLGHSIRVSRLAKKIARELGLSSSAQEEIRLAGALHDIGKIGIEDALLKRKDVLSPEGYRRILDHAVIGERILEPLFGQTSVVIQVARSHHERFDGGGFPDGIRGSAIALPARIVSVADAFDAMMSARAYRDPLPLKVATWELANGAGKQFDPDCVTALLAVIAHERRGRKRELRRSSCARVVVRRWSTPASVSYRPQMIQTTDALTPDERLRITRPSGFG